MVLRKIGAILLGLSMMACGACATAPKHLEMRTFIPGFKAAGFLVINNEHWGSACAISPKLAITVGHVMVTPRANLHDQIGRVISVEKVWQGPNFVTPDGLVDSLVLVRVVGEGAFLDFAQKATHPPGVGDKIVVVGVTDPPLRAPFFGTALTMDPIGRLLLDATVWPGTSGSCVLNSRGQVLAVISSTFMERDILRPLGTALPVWNLTIPVSVGNPLE